jgi:hypothetical protein
MEQETLQDKAAGDAEWDADWKWNPRFVVYARAHGRTPEAQLEADRAASPAVMAGFLTWMRDRREAFQKAHPEAFFGKGDSAPIADQEAWDRFLSVATASPPP